MEIAVLQQLISQEARAGGGGGGGNSTESRFITEGRFANGSETDQEVMGPPFLFATGYRHCWPSHGKYTTQFGIRTYSQDVSYAEPMVSWLYQGGNWGGGNNSSSSFDGLGSGLICYHTNERGDAFAKPFQVPDNSTSYGPIAIGIFFVRNTSTSAATFSYTQSMSSYWSSGYDGCGVSAFVFDNANLSSVTDVSFQNLWNYTGSTVGTQSGVSVNVPAGCTAAILCSQTMYYWTTYSSGGHWYYHFGFDWSSTFTGGNSVFRPDLRSTAAFWMLRDMDSLDLGDHIWSQNGKNILTKTANMAGEFFGDYT